jgi:hypothetical protein
MTNIHKVDIGPNQFDTFCDRLDALIEEFPNISHAEAVGALEFVKLKLLLRAMNTPIIALDKTP